MSTAKTAVAVRTTASAALLYWLVLLCGLEGLTIVRVDTQHLGALWVGSIAGVALGQLLGWLRVRAWLLVLMMGGLWLTPMVYSVLATGLDSSVETLFCAFIPAGICGYLALSERGALVAFWYPAVLWMLVILDGPGSFQPQTALPFGVGLAALFVAFVRARETRRTALWRAHGGMRIAKARPRSVLRTSPLRTTAQLGWTALVGASILVLTAWIAPHLWQKDTTKARPRVTSTAAAGSGYDNGYSYSYGTCCSLEEIEEAKRVHLREYFPLTSAQEEAERSWSMTRVCEPCSRKRAGITASADLDRTHVGKYRSWTYNPEYLPPSNGLGEGAPGWDPATATATPYATPSSANNPDTAPVATATSTSSTVTTTTPSAYSALAPRHDLPSTPMGAPWRAALLLSAVGIGIHFFLRAVRRSLTLRHLTRPFWAETLDQRISNHWERALIGLRDAGIHATDDEQPLAFAARVGIDGLETCAVILERVRHGVRVDAADLDQMSAAATAVYRAARQRAGVGGRAAAWLRPLSA